MFRVLDSDELFDKKQELARATGARYYGDGGTIHHDNILDIEVRNGEVVSVWFRCQMLPFRVDKVDRERANEMKKAHAEYGSKVRLTGVEVSNE